jgi:peptidoglycan L-alanyl-D-glutamate endopeptidase CwlK
MAADLTQLVPEFRERVDELVARCQSEGYEMRPYTAVRTPMEQARLWRQSRTKAEIDAMTAHLLGNNAPYLAKVLTDAGPQHGSRVTDATPGLSWHQWGEAVDCFWVLNGQAEWSTKRLANGRNGYAVYAEIASQLGLTAGGLFSSLKDWPHVQLRPAASPLGAKMTLAQVDVAMKQYFGS